MGVLYEKQVCFRLPKDDYDMITELAAARVVGRATVIRELIRDQLALLAATSVTKVPANTRKAKRGKRNAA